MRQHVFVVAGNVQLGRVAAVQLQFQLAVVHGNEVVRHNHLAAGSSGSAHGESRFGVEFADFRQHFLELAFVGVQEVQQLGVVALGQCLKAVFHHQQGHAGKRGCWALSFQLEHQAFLKIAGANAGGVQRLNALNQALQICRLHDHAQGKGEVVANVQRGPTQVTVVVQGANQVLAERFVVGGKHHRGQLLQEVVLHGLGAHERGFVALVVRALVARLGFVVRGIVVEVIRKVQGVAFLVQIVRRAAFVAVGKFGIPLVRGRFVCVAVQLRFFQGGVDFQFFLNALLQRLRLQLNQLHELDLLRAQLLLKFLGEVLVEHG